PLGELDLRDQLRPHPVRILVGLGRWLKRRVTGLEWFQALHHAIELALTESCADVPDVNQARRYINAHEQRSEVGARLAGLRPPTDHEFLLVEDFELAPIRSPLS